MKLKKADINDINIYADIINSSWVYAYKGIIPDSDLISYTDTNYRKELYKNMLEKNMDIYIAQEENESFGVIAFYQHEKDENSAYIAQFYLSPKLCHKGFGSIILSQVEEMIKEKGFKKVKLNCLFDNKSGRHFYEKNGYLFTGTEDSPLFTQKVVRALYQKEL